MTIPQDGLTYSWDEHGSEASERVFARIDVTGLSHGQIRGLREEARAMQEGYLFGPMIALVFACGIMAAGALFLR